MTDVSHRLKTLEPSRTVKEIMDTWTLQMGYPVVSVERSYSGKPLEEVLLSQKRYLLTEDTPEDKSVLKGDQHFRYSLHLHMAPARPRPNRSLPLVLVSYS